MYDYLLKSLPLLIPVGWFIIVLGVIIYTNFRIIFWKDHEKDSL